MRHIRHTGCDQNRGVTPMPFHLRLVATKCTKTLSKSAPLAILSGPIRRGSEVAIGGRNPLPIRGMRES